MQTGSVDKNLSLVCLAVRKRNLKIGRVEGFFVCWWSIPEGEGRIRLRGSCNT